MKDCPRCGRDYILECLGCGWVHPRMRDLANE